MFIIEYAKEYRHHRLPFSYIYIYIYIYIMIMIIIIIKVDGGSHEAEDSPAEDEHCDWEGDYGELLSKHLGILYHITLCYVIVKCIACKLCFIT